jgi:hypothetical protein
VATVHEFPTVRWPNTVSVAPAQVVRVRIANLTQDVQPRPRHGVDVGQGGHRSLTAIWTRTLARHRRDAIGSVRIPGDMVTASN